jgi:hypothetical protein
MRIVTLAVLASAAAFAVVPAQAQWVPVWRIAQDQQFVVPKCSAPNRLVERRNAKGQIFWRCVASAKN